MERSPTSPPPITALVQQFIDALRNELQQYGEILALLDLQHRKVLLQENEEIQQSVAAINRQQAVIQSVRAQRHEIQRELASRLDQPPTATFAQFIPRLPESYRPLVSALVQENHELEQRVEQRAQQNQGLLRRSLDMMQAFLDTLAPATRPPPAAGAGAGAGADDAPAAKTTDSPLPEVRT